MLSYGIITPAHNEEPFIADFMRSVIAQRHRPDTFVIVDDGSDDRTAAIARGEAAGHDWIHVLERPGKARHQIGSKVVETFSYGLDQFPDNSWDAVVKLDADLILPPDYFQKVIQRFADEPESGICGGVCAVPVKDNTRAETDQVEVEKLTDRYHVRGPIKAYRMACYRDIGGLPPIYGWDTLDELLAEYHGWKIRVLPDLVVIHRRPTGAKTPPLKLHKMTGEMFYRLGYGPVISLAASAKRYRMKPFMISALWSYLGYLLAALRKPEQYVTPAQRIFIRKLRYRRMREKIAGKRT